MFNDFFIKEATLNNEDDTPPDIPQLDCQLDEIVLSVMEVKNVIKNLNKNKATGPGTIHNRLLIAAADVISEPLTNLFNRCLNESKFPSQWKIAHVTPLHKKGQKDLCRNYRPISLLSCVGKVLERCVQRHVYSFLQVNRIITPSQSGFIPGDSTVEQLVCMTYAPLLIAAPQQGQYFLTYLRHLIGCGTKVYW